jgi:hypothetical protein
VSAWSERKTWLWLSPLCIAGALALGAASEHLYGFGIALLTLAPLMSHARHVGVRNMLSEPSGITVIVWFYLFVFPLRGLVIALSGYTDILHMRGFVTEDDLIAMLLLASAATTVLVESYYFARSRPSPHPRPAPEPAVLHGAVVRLTALLTALSLVGLTGVIVESGGISGARAQFIQHTVTSALQGNTSLPGSAWQLFAVPAVWCCAYVIFNKGSSRLTQFVFAISAVVIIAGALVIYGSRLNTLLGLIGAWVVYFYSGRRVPGRVILVALPLAVLFSQPILSERQSVGNTGHISAIERFSRISSYGVLDISLAVRSEPQQIRAQLTKANRWLDLPAYFVPASLWHGRPNVAARRLGLYVAQDVGTVDDQATGFPATYITEAWLLGGWPGVIILSVLLGSALGWATRRLTRDPSPSPAAVLSLAFVVTVGWTYYKDGDLLLTIVGEGRNAVYLVILLWVTGVIGHQRLRSQLPQAITRTPRS